ncbi:TenA family transcriptional regulator [Haliangium sp.]|uniref:TenA family transcriptional regulator n=1 Tax=Haliangium sp. TaxID=2663208 RepID=UPI003D0BD80B
MFDHLIDIDRTPANVFVATLERYAEESATIQHPLLDEIANGRFHDLAGSLTRFLREYYCYSRCFTRYLTSVMSRLDDPAHRAMLMPNVLEEGGHVDADHEAELLAAGIDPATVAAPHPELFRRFLDAIGLSNDEVRRHQPHLATSAWIESFDSLCRHGTQEQAIGALGLGTEGIVRHVYVKLLAGIKHAWPGLTMEDRAFFELHALIDDDHAEVMRAIAIDLSRSAWGRRQVAVGVLRALGVRQTFFDQMLIYLRTRDVRRERAA